jgi:hypothetical protein
MMEFADIFMILLWQNDAWECKGQVAKVVQGSMIKAADICMILQW